jgi:hypothetical protein
VAVVEAIGIDVVNDEASRDIRYQLAVHKDAGEFTIRLANGTFGIEGVFAF